MIFLFILSEVRKKELPHEAHNSHVDLWKMLNAAAPFYLCVLLLKMLFTEF